MAFSLLYKHIIYVTTLFPSHVVITSTQNNTGGNNSKKWLKSNLLKNLYLYKIESLNLVTLFLRLSPSDNKSWHVGGFSTWCRLAWDNSITQYVIMSLIMGVDTCVAFRSISISLAAVWQNFCHWVKKYILDPTSFFKYSHQFMNIVQGIF